MDGHIVAHGDNHSNGQSMRHRYRRLYRIGIIFLIMLLIAALCIMYCRSSAPRKIIKLDLQRFGLPTQVPNILLFTDSRI